MVKNMSKWCEKYVKFAVKMMSKICQLTVKILNWHAKRSMRSIHLQMWNRFGTFWLAGAFMSIVSKLCQYEHWHFLDLTVSNRDRRDSYRTVQPYPSIFQKVLSCLMWCTYYKVRQNLIFSIGRWITFTLHTRKCFALS